MKQMNVKITAIASILVGLVLFFALVEEKAKPNKQPKIVRIVSQEEYSHYVDSVTGTDIKIVYKDDSVVAIWRNDKCFILTEEE